MSVSCSKYGYRPERRKHDRANNNRRERYRLVRQQVFRRPARVSTSRNDRSDSQLRSARPKRRTTWGLEVAPRWNPPKLSNSCVHRTRYRVKGHGSYRCSLVLCFAVGANEEAPRYVFTNPYVRPVRSVLGQVHVANHDIPASVFNHCGYSTLV